MARARDAQRAHLCFLSQLVSFFVSPIQMLNQLIAMHIEWILFSLRSLFRPVAGDIAELAPFSGKRPAIHEHLFTPLRLPTHLVIWV